MMHTNLGPYSREERNNLANSLKPARIYIVEDESDIAELIRFNLSLEGYEVHCFPFAEECLRAFEKATPDLLVLDLMLPGMSGIEMCQRVRSSKELASLPVIMVTAKGEEQDIVRGIEAGADDYITKPFSPKVLTAKVGAVLRRTKAGGFEPQSVLEIHNIVIHPGRHEVTVDGEPVELRNSEFRILHFLAQKPGWVFRRCERVRR